MQKLTSEEKCLLTKIIRLQSLKEKDIKTCKLLISIYKKLELGE